MLPCLFLAENIHVVGMCKMCFFYEKKVDSNMEEASLARPGDSRSRMAIHER